MTWVSNIMAWTNARYPGAEFSPGHLGRPKTRRSASLQPPQVPDVPGKILAYTEVDII
jgi:hypothetical protein